MATINQIRELLKSHFNGDDDRFRVIAMQIAAHESKLGHINSANEIKALVDSFPTARSKTVKFNKANKSLELQYANVASDEIVVCDGLKEKIDRVISEYKQRNLLLKYGLKNRSKLLLEGDPGTGKTMTASVIAYETGIPLYTVQIHQLLSKFMGETSSKLSKIFEQIREYRGVYLFDEFDAIGSDRSFDNDVGEMRRILNSFLQYIEEDESASIIICATNKPEMLDKALFRRFDDVLEYRIPDQNQIMRLFELNLCSIGRGIRISDRMIDRAKGLSHADIVTACLETKKHMLLHNNTHDRFEESVLLGYIEERKQLMRYKEAR